AGVVGVLGNDLDEVHGSVSTHFEAIELLGVPEDAVALGSAQARNGGQAAQGVRGHVLGGERGFAASLDAELLAQLGRQLLGVDRRGGHYAHSLLPTMVRLRPIWTRTVSPLTGSSVLPLMFQPRLRVENSLGAAVKVMPLICTGKGLACS